MLLKLIIESLIEKIRSELHGFCVIHAPAGDIFDKNPRTCHQLKID